MIHCHRSHHRLDLHHTACIHIKFLDMSIGRLLSWSYSAEEFWGVISNDWRCQCVLLDAGICSSQSYCFSVLNSNFFSTISSEKWWSFDWRRSLFAYLMSRAFDLLIEDGISRDFDNDLADISTVLLVKQLETEPCLSLGVELRWMLWRKRLAKNHANVQVVKI